MKDHGGALVGGRGQVAVLTPNGRDAAVAQALLHDAGVTATVCHDLKALCQHLGSVEAAVVAEEALARADLHELAAWTKAQPPWSDFPFVVLTHRGGGPERNPEVLRLGDVLGSVAFLERPFHPTTLVSAVRSALAARRRQQQARDALAAEAAAAERLRFALRAGGLGSWELDGDSGELRTSDACKEVFGRAPQDCFDYADLLAAVHPDDLARMRDAVATALAEEGDYDIEYRTIWPDGSLHWAEVRGRAVRTEEGRLLMAGVSLDTTARHAAEESLRQYREQLEELVSERTQELEAANQQLRMAAEERDQVEAALRHSQKLEVVGQLTGGVAHDFNNLLTIIRSSVDFLRRPDLLEERRKRYMDAVSDTVDRAAKLTGQLLAFARRQALKLEVVDAAARLRSIADLIDTVTGARVKVVTEVPEHPCYVRTDLGQFETAVVNMAVNARDAMNGEGTLTLRLTCAAAMPPIRGHARACGPFIKLEISDTGSGIAAEQIGRIFEPFYTTKEVGRGTGLGLSQVFGFAKQSGGDVDVMSEIGRGTTFTLYLPQVEAGPDQGPATDDPEVGSASNGAGHRVLIVEDNIEVGQFALQILEDLGYQPTWATNAQEALDRLGEDGGGFDAVFSDVVMPGRDGVALAQELRQRLPDLPVILTSGYSHVLAREGTHGFALLHKPYSADQLARTLRRVIRPRGGQPHTS